MERAHLIAGITALTLVASPAWADDDEGVRELTECHDFSEALEALDEFADVDADRRDVVDVLPRPRFTAENGVPAPERAFFRSADGREVDMTIMGSGDIPDMIDTLRSVYGNSGEGEVCLTDFHFAGTPRAEPGRDFTMGLLPQVVERPARHSLVELREGARDGRKFFKKMAPGMFSFMVPKLTHYAVSHPDDDTTKLPRVTAWRSGESLGPVEMEPFDVSQMMSLQALEDMGADWITVEGDYRLYPLPDADTIRRFMD